MQIKKTQFPFRTKIESVAVFVLFAISFLSSLNVNLVFWRRTAFNQHLLRSSSSLMVLVFRCHGHFLCDFCICKKGMWRKQTTIKITCDLLHYAYLSLRMNSIEQNAHWKGFLSECEYMCCLSDHCFEYSFSQMTHVYLTPKCVSKCRSKWDFCLYRFGHWSHAYGFSPVCIWQIDSNKLWLIRH